MDQVFIIAEAGVNHNGKLELAEQIIVEASRAGADAVKFQTFSAQDLCTQRAPKAAYQNADSNQNETQFEMLKKFELGRSAHERLIWCCKENNVEFLSSPFDLKSIDLLMSLGLETIKIPSGEITNLPYLEKIGEYGKNSILSTGMSNMEEIQFAVETLVKMGTSLDNISLLHCCTQYPAPMESINLRAMVSLKEKFRHFRIGYSDHTKGYEIAIAAVAMGAAIIEKHVTLDQSMKGPDHKASIELKEFKLMVNAIRNVEKSLGDGVKRASAQEMDNLSIVRKSIVAAIDIPKGDVFTKDNITIKRPGNGLSPILWHDVLGKKATKDFVADEQIAL